MERPVCLAGEFRPSPIEGEEPPRISSGVLWSDLDFREITVKCGMGDKAITFSFLMPPLSYFAIDAAHQDFGIIFHIFTKMPPPTFQHFLKLVSISSIS